MWSLNTVVSAGCLNYCVSFCHRLQGFLQHVDQQIWFTARQRRLMFLLLGYMLNLLLRFLQKKNILLQVYIVQWEFHRLRILQCRQIVVGGCKVNCSIHGRCTLTSTMESQVITFNMPFLRLSIISNSIATISIYIFRYTWACNFCCKSRSSNYVVLLIFYVLNVTNTYLGNAYTMVQPRDANYVLHPQLCIGLSGYS